MHSPSRTLAGAFLALVVALAPAASHAQETTPPDAAQIAADEAARQAALAASGPRFDPEAGRCVGLPPESERVPFTVPPGYRPDPTMNGGAGWQVSAPRGWPGPTHAGEKAQLTLRDKFGAVDRQVRVDVTRPDDTTDRSPTWIFDDRAATLSYPSSFIGAPPLVPGAYTVVWRDKATDRFIACDGFVVVP